MTRLGSRLEFTWLGFVLIVFFPVHSFSQSCCPDGNSIITNYAGTGSFGYTGDGGQASLATFEAPQGLALDSSGDLYVVDSLNNVVRKITPGGIITTVAGDGTAGFSGDGGPATLAQISDPTFVAVDSSGDLYIADFSNNRIRKVAPDGTITTFAGNGSSLYAGDNGPATLASFKNPWGVAVDNAGDVFISDNNCAIREVNTVGTITTVAGTGSCGYSGDNGPAALAQISRPDGPRIDPAGNLYFWDNDNYRVREFSVGGTITTIAGDGTFGFSGMGGPATQASLEDSDGGIAFCGGNIYISDYLADHVVMINSCGVINTVVGNGSGGNTGNGGSASSAAISPQNIIIDGTGNMYVADRSANVIRKIAPDCAPTSTPACAIVSTPTPTDTQTPTVTITPTITNSPTITETPGPTADIFYVSQNLFTSSAPVSIHVEYSYFPGPYSLMVYNTAGELVKKIVPPQTADNYITLSTTWDGTNDHGEPCASGVYILYLIEPYNVKLKKVVLIHQ